MDKFSLKWSEFRKIREDGRLFDVTLATDDGQYIQAHKLILSAGSQFFNDIVMNSNTSNMQLMIYLKGIKIDDLRNILDFIYNGEVCLPQDQQTMFLTTAKELQIKGIDPDLSVIAEDQENEKSDNEDIKPENLILSSLEESKSQDCGDEVSKSMKTNEDLKNEINQIIEKNEGVWKCRLCEKTTYTNSAMRDHAESHITGMKHACHLCTKTFTSRPNLRTHVSHMHKGVFDCDMCGKSGMNRITSQNHKRRHHTILQK